MIKPHLHNGQSFKGLTIGLLGGSFNPAHLGHFEMSLHALKKLGLDQIWWLVSPQNPLKNAADMAAFGKRQASAQKIATHPRLIVSDIEAALKTRYTVDTLCKLQQRFPGTRFVWLMGADNLRQLPKWKKWRGIFELVPVAVFKRPAYAAGRGLGQAAIRFNQFWRSPLLGRKIARAARKGLPLWTILDNKLNPASATKIRKDNPSWHR